MKHNDTQHMAHQAVETDQPMRFGYFIHTHPEHRAPGKYIAAAPDGSFAKEIEGALSRSQYVTCTVPTLKDLHQWMVESSNPSQHLTAGIATHDSAICIPNGEGMDADGTPLIARSDDCLPFPDGAGLMCIDSDSPSDDLTFAYVFDALAQACPMIGLHAALQSTSGTGRHTQGHQRRPHVSPRERRNRHPPRIGSPALAPDPRWTQQAQTVPLWGISGPLTGRHATLRSVTADLPERAPEWWRRPE